MAKRTTRKQENLPDFVSDPEFRESLEKSVDHQRKKCLERKRKTSKWFGTFAGCCTILAKTLDKSSIASSVLSSLKSVRRLVANVPKAEPIGLSGPLVTAMDRLIEEPKLFTPAVAQIFDQVRELVYPGETETQRGGSTTQDTVQEFDRVPPLQEDELAEIEQAIEWSRSLDPDRLYAFLDLPTQQILRYLTSQGLSVRELARQLEVTHGALSHIMRGKRDPSGAIQKKVMMFAVFHLLDE